MTKTFYLKASEAADIEFASQLLRDGKLVAFPTETVYGLGGLALNQASVQSIFAAKNRPSQNPLIVHVSHLEAASKLFDFSGSRFEDKFRARFSLLSKQFWPGPLTLVGKKALCISDTVTAGSPKVAVRIPSHPVALHLLKLVGKPVAAPSANLFTRPSPTACNHVLANLDGRVDAVIDGGSTEFGIESTVVDIDGDRPKILRHGAISQLDLSRVLSDLDVAEIGSPSDAHCASPGMSVKHYSPKITTVTLANETDLAKSWFTSSGIILRETTAVKLSTHLGERPLAAGPVKALPDDPKGFATALFCAFYEMEDLGLTSLIVEDLRDLASSDWSAVCDRLVRAQS